MFILVSDNGIFNTLGKVVRNISDLEHIASFNIDSNINIQV